MCVSLLCLCCAVWKEHARSVDTCRASLNRQLACCIIQTQCSRVATCLAPPDAGHEPVPPAAAVPQQDAVPEQGQRAADTRAHPQPGAVQLRLQCSCTCPHWRSGVRHPFRAASRRLRWHALPVHRQAKELTHRDRLHKSQPVLLSLLGSQQQTCLAFWEAPLAQACWALHCGA